MDCAAVEYELATSTGLSPSPAAAAHMQTCAACTALSQMTDSVDEALAGLDTWTPPPHFARTVGLQGADVIRMETPRRGFVAWWPRIESAAIVLLVWITVSVALPLLAPAWQRTTGSTLTTTWLWVLGAGSVSLFVTRREPDRTDS